MQMKHAVLFFISLLTVTSVFSQTAAPISADAEYDILFAKTQAGQPIYALVCNNGTTNCNYKWNSLCKDGTAQNSDPTGNVSDAPAYVRDKNNRPMRVFVCK